MLKIIGVYSIVVMLNVLGTSQEDIHYTNTMDYDYIHD